MITAFAALGTSAALAEPSTYTAPDIKILDANGVDLVSGQYNRSDTFLTIGDPSSGGLAWTYTGHPSTDNYTGELIYVPAVGASPAELRVKVSGSTDTFIGYCATQSCVNLTGGASKLEKTATNWLYTTGDGTLYIFDILTIDQPTYSTIRSGKLVSITKPNGDIITINHEYLSSCTANTQTCNYRIKSVVSNRGYALKYEYEAATFDRLDTIRAVNRSQTYCDDLIASCNAYHNAITFDYPGSGLTFKVTDAMGNATEFGVSNNNVFDTEVISYVKQPDGWEITALYDTYGRITSLSNPEGTWTYSYSDNTLTAVQNTTTPRTVTVKDSANVTVMSASVLKSVMMPLSSTDGAGKTTTYTVMQYTNSYGKKWGRVTTVTKPEGNKAGYTYDARGNVTSITSTPKTGSGQAAITISANFDTSCTSYKSCNKPNSAQDGKGSTTSYTYDATHGGVLTVTSPVDNAGVTPKSVTTYAQFTAQVKTSTGTMTNAGTVWLPQTSSVCATAITCDGTVNQLKTTTAYGTYNLQPTLTTTAAGDNSLSAATASAYDGIGNVISSDGPLSGTVDQAFKTYDANRRIVYEIGVDPDSGGSLLRSMTRHLYDVNGRETQTESGIGASTVGTDFARKSYVVTHFNARGLKDWTAAYIDGLATAESLSQFNYNIRGQLICTAVRMNPAVYATITATDACALGTESAANGPDRISKNTYDNAGRVTQIDQAFATPIQRAYARYTYSDNGLKATEKDANGNLTTLEYDGHDRLKKLRYPSTTVASGTSSTTDYEEYAYDDNGNRTYWRRRDGQVLNDCFDNLNRIIVHYVHAQAGCTAGGGAKDVYTTYDLLGRVKAKRFASYGGTGVSYSYDGLGRMSSTTDMNGRIVSYQYNAAGARTRLTFPDSVYIGADLDNASRVKTMGWNAVSGIYAQAYNSLAQLTGETKGGGSVTYVRDNFGRLTSMTNNLSGTADDITWSFAYNPAGQQVSNTASSTVYDYEELTSITEPSQTHDGLNRISTLVGTTASCPSGGYDNRQNLICEGSRNFVYDVENRLLSAAPSLTPTVPFLELTYDPEGRLSSYKTIGTTIKITEFVYDGVELIAEYNHPNGATDHSTDTLLRRYVHGAGTDDPVVWYEGAGNSLRRYFFKNYQGSIITTADSTGVRGEIYAYGPYGETKDSVGNFYWPTMGGTATSRFGYTGQVFLAEASLYHYKARVYDPLLGRFLQTDPVGSKDDLNLYQYGMGDPVNGTDPTGMIFDGVVAPASMRTGDSSVLTSAPQNPRVSTPAKPTSPSPLANGPIPTNTVTALASTLVGLCGDTKGTCRGSDKSFWRLTYTKKNPTTQKVYSGRASGFGTSPLNVLTQRDRGHHMNGKGFGPAVLDRYLKADGALNDLYARAAVRGREQLLIENNGYAQSDGGTSGNAINGISKDNILRGIYISTAIEAFGPLGSGE